MDADTGKNIVAPNPALILESLRSIGYSLENAIADIIDNSVTADASTVHVCFFPIDDPYLAIIDDGCGMDDNEITRAMQYGSTNPLDERSQKDLGRFGLGLKTASLSQCRQLTVVSKHDSHWVGRRWDIDHVCATGKWSLIVLSEEEIQQLECIDTLRAFPSGTMVLWKKLDRMQKGEIDGLKNFILSGQWILRSGGLPPAVITGKFSAQRICVRDGKKFCAN